MALPFAAITADFLPNTVEAVLVEVPAGRTWSTPQVSVVRLSDAENASGNSLDSDSFDFS